MKKLLGFLLLLLIFKSGVSHATNFMRGHDHKLYGNINTNSMSVGEVKTLLAQLSGVEPSRIFLQGNYLSAADTDPFRSTSDLVVFAVKEAAQVLPNNLESVLTLLQKIQNNKHDSSAVDEAITMVKVLIEEENNKNL